ncbi:sulfite exporter TauE/SafE family protein [Limibaculum sp. FT325]|uniref:sulfite exporter TauE/SafE family protein n=1 Tax=Thermohalobaculum sediminis TaxID=2939436 RepID=UPI0020BEEB9D|nr:sulfite exporter TauE/SafE family protein [Limibaculum sediminis]MCL5778136.1 sulfite exporter TauE/SafE family protein [Limibaculum sediminis]
MNIYLPIAEVSVNVFLLLGLGGGVGVLSGLFGVGGGFLITPLLIFIGIPPAVAVATGTNQVAAASFSGVLTHWRRRTVDIRMGLVLLAGGIVGSGIGVQLFAWLRRLGHVEIFVSLCYVVFLGIVGALMLAESIQARRRTRRGTARRVRRHHWVHGLPLKMRFRQSNLYISAIPPFAVGMLVGVLAAVMGVGGGFIMVPAMIYILGMATSVVVGTSLFQILFVAAFTTMLHAVMNQTVDALLAIVLIVGGVLGAQVGARLSPRLRAEELRIALSVLVLIVCLKLAVDLVRTPDELFSLAGPR